MSRKRIDKPIENQSTAPWANIGRAKEISNVAVLNEFLSVEAKEYVDDNEK
ncbi:MAG: DUF3787 domain-containing protein [Eubacteriales bacterium]